MVRKIVPQILLTPEEYATLGVWLRLPGPARLTLRAKIVLAAAEGQTNQEIARQLGTSPKTVSLWRRRFLESRLTGIEKEAPRKRQESIVSREMVHLIIQKTTEERPASAARWTIRSLAERLGVSPSLVHRVWKAHGVSPCRD